MAQGRRSKSQARRSGGDGLPGWAWLVMGVALTLLVVLAVPRLFDSGDEGFFRPTPNPEAEPQPVDDEAVVDDVDEPAPLPTPAVTGEPAVAGTGRGNEFDFYTLLPGREVPMSDAELAASEQAEQQAAMPTAPAATTEQDTATGQPALPTPLEEPEPDQAEAAAATDQADDSARYILQAGAFEASGQAEELKAKIALLGLGARVESAQIGGRTVYRVRMGPYGTASELAEAKRKLANGGLSGMAVKVD